MTEVQKSISAFKNWIGTCLLLKARFDSYPIPHQGVVAAFQPLLAAGGEIAIELTAKELTKKNKTRDLEHGFIAMEFAQTVIANAKDEHIAEELQLILNEKIMSGL